MPHFHFHFRENDQFCRDDPGIAYDSVEEAYLAAYRAAVEMWSELLKERRDPRHCTFEIANETDQVVLVLPFTEVLDACTRGAARPELRKSGPLLTSLEAHKSARESCQDLLRELKIARQILHECRRLILGLDRIVSDGSRQPSNVAMASTEVYAYAREQSPRDGALSINGRVAVVENWPGQAGLYRMRAASARDAVAEAKSKELKDALLELAQRCDSLALSAVTQSAERGR